jgi:hypothetical protein
MANSDYINRTTGAFCSIAKLATPVQPTTTQFAVSDLRLVEGEPAAVGAVLLINDEFMAISAVSGSVWTVKRGCIDTIPGAHGSGSNVFILGTRVASDETEYLGTETISLKLLAKTTAGRVPIEYAPPAQIIFDRRFARPYPPAQMRANGVAWVTEVVMDSDIDLALTWVGRNRVMQADQILGQADAGVTAEDGTTYTVKMYTDADVLVRTVTGITGLSWTYTFSQMIEDYGLIAFADTGIYRAYLTFYAMRDGLTSWQGYRVPLALDTGDMANASALALYGAMRAFWEFEDNSSGTTFADAKATYPLSIRNSAGALASSAATAGTPNAFVNRVFYPNSTEGIVAYIPVSAGFKLPNTSWTFGAWLAGSSGAGGSTRFVMGNIGSAATDFQAYLGIDSGSNTLVFGATTDGTTVGRVMITSSAQLDPSTMTLITCTFDRAANLLKLRWRRSNAGSMSSAQATFTGALYTGSTNANFAINDALSGDSTYFSGDRSALVRADQAFVVNLAIDDTQFDYLFNGGAGVSWASLSADAGY